MLTLDLNILRRRSSHGRSPILARSKGQNGVRFSIAHLDRISPFTTGRYSYCCGDETVWIAKRSLAPVPTMPERGREEARGKPQELAPCAPNINPNHQQASRENFKAVTRSVPIQHAWCVATGSCQARREFRKNMLV